MMRRLVINLRREPDENAEVDVNMKLKVNNFDWKWNSQQRPVKKEGKVHKSWLFTFYSRFVTILFLVIWQHT